MMVAEFIEILKALPQDKEVTLVADSAYALVTGAQMNESGDVEVFYIWA